ncbi:peptidoglycan editing factor PgeF [Acetonema longum]|uniref:Purine nucleoside phosphorylase n=1 Tax=Acetonema longum DSM 6540 TaxID=1009370 RepID=F7NLB3_9FIRM|nr:peptidoglycan editing factor PgeF [Acetonema longum]EGO63218.1 hypothetical protein ALO_14427 [Acetonema longum DSM 6540]
MSDFVLQAGSNGLWYGTFKHLPVKHAISTRLGGISRSPYRSLNLGIHTGDDLANVIENRKLFCQALHLDFQRVVTAQQVHEDKIAVVTAVHAGKGAANYSEALGATDALITNTPDLPLMLFFADCVPVLICDPVRCVIGLSHAGWKGTAARIAAKTVIKMGEVFDARPQDCLVGIGPSIGPASYEVDDSVMDPFKTAFPAKWPCMLKSREDKWMLDLWQANRVQLEEIGVVPEHITVSGISTAENLDLFFSHRMEKGTTGRMGVVMSL